MVNSEETFYEMTFSSTGLSISAAGRGRSHVDSRPLQAAAGHGGRGQRAGRAEGDLGGCRQEGDGRQGSHHFEYQSRR